MAFTDVQSKLSRTTAVGSTLVLSIVALVQTATAQEEDSGSGFECPVSKPMSATERHAVTENALRLGVPSGQDDDDEKFAASGSFYGNEGLWTLLNVDDDGRLVFTEGGGGFNDYDGALGIKWPWFRVAPGLLAIGGRRLDGDAPPARAYIFPYALSGFQPTSLVFPTPGCWEITGGVGPYRLTFVVEVQKMGAGPLAVFDSPLDGLSAGRYLTDRADMWGVTPWTEFLQPDEIAR